MNEDVLSDVVRAQVILLLNDVAAEYKEKESRGVLTITDLKRIFDHIIEKTVCDYEKEIRATCVEVFASHGIDATIFLKDFKG
jgi:hypothetical protein